MRYSTVIIVTYNDLIGCQQLGDFVTQNIDCRILRGGGQSSLCRHGTWSPGKPLRLSEPAAPLSQVSRD